MKITVPVTRAYKNSLNIKVKSINGRCPNEKNDEKHISSKSLDHLEPQALSTLPLQIHKM